MGVEKRMVICLNLQVLNAESVVQVNVALKVVVK